MKVVVVSPHLDDAVLSVGATMNSLRRRGADVHLVTLFAGDTSRPARPSYWDAKRGLDDKAAVIAARRQEDEDATRCLDVTPHWLPFDDVAYVSNRDPEAMWAMLAPLLLMATAIIVPGWPLTHADHRFTTLMVVERLRSGVPLYFYAEMPYGARPIEVAKSMIRGRRAAPLTYATAGDVLWLPTLITDEDLRAKRQATGCYEGELSALGLEGRFGLWHDRVFGSEHVGHARDVEPLPFLFGDPS